MFYTYYVKAENKYYFGSRTPEFMLNQDAKDDFMIKYFTSTTDERLQEIIRNKEYEKAEIIKEYTDRQECLKDEERLIKLFWTFYGRLNCWNHFADMKFSTAGTHQSNETKEKISEAWNNKSEEDKQARNKKISEALNGKKLSEDHRQNISEALKGENNPMYGTHQSNETKEKISEAIKELWNNISEADKQNFKETMSEVTRGENNPMYGKQHSEEAKEKIREAHIGKHHSEEAKEKIREGVKETYNNKSEEDKQARNKKIREAQKGKPKPKYRWKSPTGEIIVMDSRNAKRWHPDYVYLGPADM